MRLFGRWRGRFWPAGAAWDRECRGRSIVLLPNLSDTAATIQDGSSLEFIAAIAGRQCYIQDASCRGLWQTLNYVTSGDDGGSDYEWVVMVAVVIRAPTNLKLARTSPKLTAKCFLNIASKKPH